MTRHRRCRRMTTKPADGTAVAVHRFWTKQNLLPGGLAKCDYPPSRLDPKTNNPQGLPRMWVIKFPFVRIVVT
jgi:hypothetical protein